MIDWAESESKKRLMRLTKEQLLQSANVNFRIAMNFISIRNRYENLKSALDILRDENTACLNAVKHIEEVYEKANECKFNEYEDCTKEFDRLAGSMPDEVWLY
jgi:hypothetical protein